MMAMPRNSSPHLPILALAVAMTALFVVYFDTARSVVSIWNRSETFAHGYVILPISLWLIWRRRRILANLSPAPFWPALLLLAACGFAWLLAELGDVQVVRQYAFVAMMPIVVLAVFGVRATWAMAFPLCFLLLAVPFGEIFIAPLIDFTANFTVAALQATGIPVLRNGNSFDIPSGSWSVVEACSGVRYLISSVTLGSLYAYLSYRSTIRRAMFVLLSIIVPIVANGMRAYMIVMIGHLSGMQLATGVDHLIYGWVFFGLVMFLMFWIGSFWREDQQENEPMEQPAQRPAPFAAIPPHAASAAWMMPVTLGAIICLSIWPAYARYIEKAGFKKEAAQLAGFQPRWQEAQPFTDWRPRFFPANAELHRFFQRDAREVGVSMMFYRNQSHGAELISSGNQLVQEKDHAWRHIATTMRRESVGGRTLAIREARIQGATPLVVWYWYWIDGTFTANDYVGKLLQAKSKFLMHGDDGAALMVFAPYTANPDEARVALRSFLTENLVPLEATLASNTQRKGPARQ